MISDSYESPTHGLSYAVPFVFGLWRVCFPPCLVRPGRRLPVQGLSEGSLGFRDREPAWRGPGTGLKLCHQGYQKSKRNLVWNDQAAPRRPMALVIVTVQSRGAEARERWEGIDWRPGNKGKESIRLDSIRLGLNSRK